MEKSFHFESSVAELTHFFKTTTSPQHKSEGNCIQPSDTFQIKTLCTLLSASKDDSQRLDLFKKNYERYCYSIAEIRQVGSQFIHDREKLDVLKLLYFYCVEKGKYEGVIDLFSYKETANELSVFINKQH